MDSKYSYVLYNIFKSLNHKIQQLLYLLYTKFNMK